MIRDGARDLREIRGRTDERVEMLARAWEFVFDEFEKKEVKPPEPPEDRPGE